MKNILTLFILLLSSFMVLGQSKKLIVEGSASDPYISHVIQPKENFYSIGRIYNISPRVYAPYNNLALEGGLTIGNTLKIPLNEINFSKDGAAADDEVIVPLYRGNNDLFGYLKVKKELSPLASQASAPKKGSVATNTPAPKPVDPVKQPETPKQPSPVKEPIKEPIKEPVVTKEPGTNTEGFFKSAYIKQNVSTKNVTAKAGVFKSTSGWSDGKFYCFHNRAATGSIVAITHPNTGKTVYAKVLDVVPDISENVGIDVRISNAAAEALGTTDATFNCTLSY